MNIKFIEKKTVTVVKTVEKTIKGKKVEEKISQEEIEETPIVFEAHPHEVLVSVLQRYTKEQKKRLPPGTATWVPRLKNGDLLGVLRTVKENDLDEEKGIYLEAV